MIGSPLKKQRASLSGIDEESLRSKFGLGLLGASGDVLGRIEQDKAGGGKAGPEAQDRPLFGSSLDSISRDKVTFGESSGTHEADKAAKIEEMEEEL
jgi:hypothetical protein